VKTRSLSVLAIAGAVCLATQTPLTSQTSESKARNVILLIGDGMGDSEITIARNYQYGAAGRLAMDELPFTGSATTYSLVEGDPSKVDYVTDSAAGAQLGPQDARLAMAVFPPRQA
jgi:alkaline phosphatase